MKTTTITTPISVAELIDKITILEIKSKRIHNKQKLQNIRYELAVLKKVFKSSIRNSVKLRALTRSLLQVNIKIWEIEDKIRLLEKSKDYESAFVQAARLIYITNDKRSEIKKKINLLLNSGIIEEKSYEQY